MKRKEALTLLKIWKLEKKYNRPVYQQELLGHHICGKKQSQDVIYQLFSDGFLTEHVIHGANAYSVNRRGQAGMEAYLDIKREMAG